MGCHEWREVFMKCFDGSAVLCFVFGFLISSVFGDSGRLESVIVKTKAPSNRTVRVFYRVPAGYQAKRNQNYRVLILFGGRNNTGRGEAGGRLGWGKWADENEIFLVSPGFRNDEYWHPEKWSGKALWNALAQIKKKYRICDTKVLYYGYSGGAQCSNLFPAWKPGSTRAWVSHAGGVFHEPSAKMRGVPGLVTCGDADLQRYVISRNFVEKSRGKGIPVIWKSYPNHPHDVPPDSLELARTFLGYYHTLYLDDLCSGGRLARNAEKKVLFVGDDQDRVVYPAESMEAKLIDPEDRVDFISKEIAYAWGAPAK